MAAASTFTIAGAGVLVIIPTFNERLNIASIVSRTLAALPQAHLLIVDDGSPDGTGDLAEQLAAGEERIRVMHRSGKQGLGAAYIAGFRWGLERSYGAVVELDADGSHPPESLPALVTAVLADPTVGLAIGSRWVKGGSVVNWPKNREILSRSANVYARLALGIDVHDTTAGFRVYRSEVLAGIDFASVDSKGYCFQIDLTLRTVDAGYGVIEVPIVFQEREFGESKMSGNIVVEAMRNVTVWGVQRRAAQLGKLFRRTPA